MSTTLAPWVPEQVEAILANKSLRDTFLADMQAQAQHPATQAHIVRRYYEELQRLPTMVQLSPGTVSPPPDAAAFLGPETLSALNDPPGARVRALATNERPHSAAEEQV